MPRAHAMPHGSTANANPRKLMLATRCQPSTKAAAATTQISTITPARQPCSQIERARVPSCGGDTFCKAISSVTAYGMNSSILC